MDFDAMIKIGNYVSLEYFPPSLKLRRTKIAWSAEALAKAGDKLSTSGIGIPDRWKEPLVRSLKYRASAYKNSKSCEIDLRSC